MPDLNQTLKAKLDTLLTQMKNERASFKSHWRDLSDYILPRRQRFTLSDVNRGERKNLKIYDSTATFSARTLKSGMMAGITSPARPWFRLSTPDPELADVSSVQQWLHEVTQRIKAVFTKSNLYQVLPTIYGDIGVFGTAVMFAEEDAEDVIRFSDYPVGSYLLANNGKGKIDVFGREFRLTVRQIVDRFGRKGNGEIDWTNISSWVKSQWDTGQTEAWVDLVHFILPNEEYDPNKLDAKFKKYLSVYYEYGTVVNGRMGFRGDGKTLGASGFDYFPVLAPRWDVTGEDIYGSASPGMDTLGDIKQVQLGEKRILQAIEKMVNPPMKGPPQLRKANASIVPGDITYIAETSESGFKPVHEVDPRVQEMEAKQEQARRRIQRGFYEDLFLMLATSDRRQITAREIDERHEEKLLALGPTLEQLNQSLLDPLIDITYSIMEKQGRIPTPPPELEGVTLKVEYVSIMAQAQKLVGIAGLERFTGFVGQIAGQLQDPAILDMVNVDEIIMEHHDSIGLNPNILRSKEEVDEIRQGRADAQAKQEQAEAAKAMTSGAKDLAGANLEGDNALNRLLQQSEAGNLVPGQ